MVSITEGFLEVAIEVSLSGIWTHGRWIPFRRSNRLSYQNMSSTRSQSQPFTATPILSLCSYIYIYIYEQETKKPSSVWMCCTVTIKQKIKSLFDQFSYSFNTYSCLWMKKFTTTTNICTHTYTSPTNIRTHTCNV